MAEIQTYLYGKKFPNRIFVGGLPLNTSAQELADFFSVFGHVTETKIILDDSGLSKGYGFVTFQQKSSVRNVESVGIIYFKNKKINIGPAVKKEASIVQPELVVWPQSSPVASAASTNIMAQQTYQSLYYNNFGYVSQPLEPYYQLCNDSSLWVVYPMANASMEQNMQFPIPYSSSSTDGETKVKKYSHTSKRKDVPPRFKKK